MEENFEDPLIRTMVEHSVVTKEKCASIMHGKSKTIRNVNLCIGSLLMECSQKKWLEVMTEKLLNLHFVLQSQASGGIGGTIPDFHYIPVPGKENGERILHRNERKINLMRTGREPTEQEIALSPLGNPNTERSRELCWMIPYRSTRGVRKLLFLLTFDPHHLAKLRNQKEEMEKAKAYWEALALEQEKIHPTDNPKHLFLHGLTGIHEWIEALFPPEGKEKKEWTRHTVSTTEKEKGALAGLDIYYSNSLVSYGWSTLEKPKGRERSRINLQQILSKKVVLFDPIYGKSTGDIPYKPEYHKQIIRLENTEKEITARAIWESAILQAYSTGASDIHLEPQEEEGKGEINLVISLRKDNEVTFFAKCPSGVGENVVRYALESSGVIRTDTDHGQDGRKTWTHPTEKKTIDLRISVTPMRPGGMQEVVIRLLDNNRLKGGLRELGLETDELEIWRRALALEEALILVSGPTGSGKSSTLFAAVCDIYNRDPKRKITSIEDPIEYSFPFRATQHEIKESTGMTFPAYIRRMMRNDVDTVLVGEIRDRETLFAALQLGLTGHQILSTIHAKSAADTVLRMLEFGPEKYIVSEVTKLVVAQRLAATPCPVCSRTMNSTEAEHEIQKNGGLSRYLGYVDRWKQRYPHIGDGKWKKADGCSSCRFTGVQGKTALQEFLIISKDNKKYLKEGNVGALQNSMLERELYSLETTAWKLAWMGKIPITEAGRLTNSLEENSR